MNIQRHSPPAMGNFLEAITASAQELFTAKGGQIIEVPGAPAALSMSIVGVLAGAVVLAMVMKKEKIL